MCAFQSERKARHWAFSKADAHGNRLGSKPVTAAEFWWSASDLVARLTDAAPKNITSRWSHAKDCRIHGLAAEFQNGNRIPTTTVVPATTGDANLSRPGTFLISVGVYGGGYVGVWIWAMPLPYRASKRPDGC